jgi:hypothetical protein
MDTQEQARPAEIVLVGWHGVGRQQVEMVGETPQRDRMRVQERPRLAGRDRWLEPGRTALVPRRAVRFPGQAEPKPSDGRGIERER